MATGIPIYSNEAKTPFQAKLFENGYTSWYVFDIKGDPLAFWKALAYGLQMHRGWKYPRVFTFLDNDWKPKMKPIIDIIDRNPPEEELWNEIGATFLNLVEKVFLDAGKKEQADMIKRGQLLNESNYAAYNTLASHFRMCMTWYQFISTGEVMTTSFHTPEKRQTCLFVNIATEGNSLYLLFHQDLHGSARIGFPFFMLALSEGEPLKIGGQLAPMQTTKDAKEALIEALMALVNTQAEILLAETQTISSQGSLDTLREKKAAVECLTSAVSIAGLVFPSKPLKDVLNLPVKPRVNPRPPHTPATCREYPEDTDYITFHGHEVHRVCVWKYLNSLLPVKTSIKPKCPIEACSQFLADDILNVNPEFASALKSHNETLKINATMMEQQRVASSIQTYQTLPPLQVSCLSCNRVLVAEYRVNHSCPLCNDCAYYEYCNIGRCRHCNQLFSEEDSTRFYKYWYSQQSP